MAKKTLLARESEAQRLIDPLVGRTWAIVNPSAVNELGEPAGYKLVPGDTVLPPMGKGSQAWDRGQFAYKHLWVTPYEPGERYAAGDYPNQNGRGGGLPEFVKADRSIEDQDIVVWYSFGNHHVVRPEDWPITPVTTSGSTSSRSASSTATRHWTCRAPRPPATAAASRPGMGRANRFANEFRSSLRPLLRRRTSGRARLVPVRPGHPP
ncbi:MAG: hypothetical protein WKF47_17140 [Geodermatophilaceae bacterium]